MASTALAEWQSDRADRITQLYNAHSRVEGGEARGRRWRTGQVNRLIVIALAAEFQGFARDLHDLVVDHFVEETAFLGYGMAPFLRALLTRNRSIDRGNPGVQALSEDFGRFGLDLWPALRERHVQTGVRQDQLTRLLDARNGIAHADDEKIESLEADGYPMTLKTAKRWQSSLNGLTDTMDRVMSDYVVEVYGGPKPW